MNIMNEPYDKKMDDLATQTIRKFIEDGMTEAEAAKAWANNLGYLCATCGENAYEEFLETGKAHICKEE